MTSRPRLSYCRGLGAAPIVAVLMFLAPILSIQKALVMAPALTLVAVAVLVGGWRGARLPMGRDVLAIIGVALVWCAATALWSFDTAFSIKNVLMLVGDVVIGGIVMDGFRRFDVNQRRLVLLGLAVGLAATAAFVLVLGVIDRTSFIVCASNQGAVCQVVGQVHIKLNSVSRTATILALLLWPVGAWLVRLGRRRSALLLVVLVVPAVLLSLDLAAKVALAASGLAWMAVRIRPCFSIKIMGAAMISVALLAPFATRHFPDPAVSADWSWLPSSAHHRLTIWTFVGQNIFQKPLAGWGFESSRSIPGGKGEVPVIRHGACEVRSDQVVLVEGQARPVPAGCVVREELLPLHPHNAWLQIWLELGAIGAALSAGLLWLIFSRFHRASAEGRSPAIAMATLVAAFVIASVAFGAWQSWWLCTVWLAVALTAPLLEAEPTL